MKIDICCNTEDDVLFENIKSNSSRVDFFTLKPYESITELPKHDGHAVIVGGGPSLKDHIETIRWRKSIGQKIFALNGACEYLNKFNIIPDYLVILDARIENRKFIENSNCKEYLIASQCHPEILNSLYVECKSDCVFLWHAHTEGIQECLPDKRESLTLIGGGTTVGLSSMCLAYTMGFRKIHLYGYDSSHEDKKSHVYDQDLNYKEPICNVNVFDKKFKASLAMAKQAEFFPTVCNNLIDLGCLITVEGDGLLPFIVDNLNKLSFLNKIGDVNGK